MPRRKLKDSEKRVRFMVSLRPEVAREVQRQARARRRKVATHLGELVWVGAQSAERYARAVGGQRSDLSFEEFTADTIGVRPEFVEFVNFNVGISLAEDLLGVEWTESRGVRVRRGGPGGSSAHSRSESCALEENEIALAAWIRQVASRAVMKATSIIARQMLFVTGQIESWDGAVPRAERLNGRKVTGWALDPGGRCARAILEEPVADEPLDTPSPPAA